MSHPCFVAFTILPGFDVSTVLLRSGDCFETMVQTSLGREVLVWQSLSREIALVDHAQIVRAIRDDALNCLENFYVSFLKTK